MAGVSLKLVGYGLLRVFPVLFKSGSVYSFVCIALNSVGGFFYIGLFCMGQTDLWSLIAYSSVVHMIMVIGGVLTLRNWGGCRSYVLIVAHVSCFPGPFFV